MNQEPTSDELFEAFDSVARPSGFSAPFGDLTRRGVTHVASLVNDGVWSVDDLLRAIDERPSDDESDPAEREQLLRDVARELDSKTNAERVEQHLTAGLKGDADESDV